MRKTLATAAFGLLAGSLAVNPALAAPQAVIERERRATEEVKEAVHELEALINHMAVIEALARDAVEHARAIKSLDDDEEFARKVKETARELEGLISRVPVLKALARDAVAKARTAESHEDEKEFARKVIDLDEQLQALASRFSKRAAALRDATDSMKTRILDALKLSSLGEVESELEAVETQLGAEKAKDADVARRLRGLVKYYLAENMREQAVRMAQNSRDDRRAASVLRRASGKYKEVLKEIDVSVPEIGTSLHAAAWHKIAIVEASPYLGYRRLVEQGHNVSSYRSKMRTHAKAARRALAELRRLHPDARHADGRRVVDAADQDVRRLLR